MSKHQLSDPEVPLPSDLPALSCSYQLCLPLLLPLPLQPGSATPPPSRLPRPSPQPLHPAPPVGPKLVLIVIDHRLVIAADYEKYSWQAVLIPIFCF